MKLNLEDKEILINYIIMINFKYRDIIKKYLEIVINVLIFSC